MKQLILPPAIALSMTVFLSGCAGFDVAKIMPKRPAPETAETTPAALPEAPPPPKNAVTVDQFDTASVEAKEEAVASSPPPKAGLGNTIATLGDVSQPGFWLETPLVDSMREGRVTSSSTGRTVKVELRPITGPDGAGSRISLSALRLLDLPLAGLHEVEVSNL